ncbi:MAG: immunoglobulin domain-containing protein [Verrucomicrobia bacterium]|nr:immunoglobulin domain-containing protein [Verrucomicrobiota bacterium]
MCTSSRSLRTAFGLAAFWAVLSLAEAGTFKTITVDGSFGDWAGVPVAYEDPADSTSSADYRRIWIANDDDYLYLRFTLERAANPFQSNANLFIDTDANPDTGFRIVLGSELLIQSGSGYDERQGGFNEGGVEGLGWQSAPEGSATEFEVRISRGAKYATDAAPVFPNGTLALLLEAEDSNFARQETAPDSEGLVYTLAEAPPVLTEAKSLVALSASSWRVNDTGADLGSSWRELDFDDSGAGWRSGSALFGYPANPSGYPAAVTTPLATSANTVYLRTKFTWENANAGLVFAVSNWLSDGAVVYLNGAEVRRVRLPAGVVTAATPATGGPTVPGVAELFGLPAGPFIIGENVLAVELHQSAVSPADLVFGLSLTATPSYPVRLVNAAEPANQTVTAGDSVTLTAEVLGTLPLTYEWRRNGSPVLGGNGPSLTFNPVLKSDEGSYTLLVTNPGGTAVSREAQLVVNVTPVTLTDPALPADLTVLEGGTATFTVVAAGSPPISYQWLKDGFPVNGATGATLTLTPVSTTDAGLYTVQVSNPATPNLLSRAARLTVPTDRIPPTLQGVAGTPNRVTVTFSEPMDPVTAATAARYSLSGGLSVSAAAISAENPAVVVLTTSPQTLFTTYSLTVSGVLDRFGNAIAPGSSGSFRSDIVIDGQFDDWAGVALAHSDPSEPPTAGTDFADIWVANDDRFLFVRFTLHTPGDPGTFLNNIFLDTDSENTGFGTYGIGSEMLIQQGAGYQQKNGGFNEGGIEGLDFAMAPAGAATQFELRIARAAKYASDQLPVFVGEAVKFFLETENSSFVTTDTAPDSGGLEYVFVPVTPGDVGPLAIELTEGQVVLTWPGAGVLQSKESLGSGDWTPVAGATSGIRITPGASPSFYRLVP